MAINNKILKLILTSLALIALTACKASLEADVNKQSTSKKVIDAKSKEPVTEPGPTPPITEPTQKPPTPKVASTPVTKTNYTGNDPKQFGLGTSEDPHIIVNENQFWELSKNTSLWSEVFKLESDIDLSQFDQLQLNPIGNETDPFTGVFDGDGHKIIQMDKTYSNTANAGLFGYVEEAILKNINFEDVKITLTAVTSVGTLVGKIDQASKVENINVTNLTIQGSGDRVGGIIGLSQANVSNLQVNGTGSINVTGDSVGGVIGETGFVCPSIPTGMSHTIKMRSLHSTINITGTNNVGGVVGSTGISCIFPELAISITESSATGNISGNNSIGGLWGFGDHISISHSYAIGEVNGSISVGGLAGYTSRSTALSHRNIYASYASGNVIGTNQVGGLVGAVGSGNIFYSYSTGNVTGIENIGGITGYLSVGNITHSYARGNVSGTGDGVGGLVGRFFSASVFTSYASGNLSHGASNYGGLVGIYNGSLLVNNIQNSFWNEQLTGISNSCGFAASFCNDAAFGKTDAELKTVATYNSTDAISWSFYQEVDSAEDYWVMPASDYPRFRWDVVTPTFAGGDGSIESPYQIATADQFNQIGNNFKLQSKHFEIVADINFNSLSSSFVQWTDFSGTLDGRNFTLSNLVFTSTDKTAAMIARGSTHWPKIVRITNINIENFDFDSTSVSIGNGIILGSNSSIDAQARVEFENITISNSTIDATSATGGICGSCTSIKSSQVDAMVTGTSTVGGLAGTVGSIEDSSFTGNVSWTGINAGGLTGILSTENDTMTIKNSWANAIVNGNDRAGGLVGYINISKPPLAIENSFAKGDLTVSGNTAGGLVGSLIAGDFYISNSFAKLDILSNENVGGIIGNADADGTIANTYYHGSITAGTVKGAIMGAFTGIVSYSRNYWDLDSNAGLQDTSAGSLGDTSQAKGLTTAEMTNQSSFETWDFDAVWKIAPASNNGHPELQ